eukprot:symbB.v1.2.002765.t1/scaffold141.1/size300911/16
MGFSLHSLPQQEVSKASFGLDCKGYVLGHHESNATDRPMPVDEGLLGLLDRSCCILDLSCWTGIAAEDAQQECQPKSQALPFSDLLIQALQAVANSSRRQSKAEATWTEPEPEPTVVCVQAPHGIVKEVGPRQEYSTPITRALPFPAEAGSTKKSLLVHGLHAQMKDKAVAPNPYVVLGIQVGAAEEDVKKAYRTLALQCHPDKRPPEERQVAEELFKDVRQAYDILRDPEKRSEFDAVASRRPRSCQRFPSGLAASILRRHSRRPRSACTPDFDFSGWTSKTTHLEKEKEKSGVHPGQAVPFVPPAFADHIWFARGSASVGRAYKGQEVEELASDRPDSYKNKCLPKVANLLLCCQLFSRQNALSAAATWLRGNPRGTCLLEVRGCSARGEVPWRQQESLAKARCEKTMTFLTKQLDVPSDRLRWVSQIREDFQGVELIGMRRLCVDGGFLNDGSLLLGDETTIPVITRYLLADATDDRMLFFEVTYTEDFQALASRRKAALLAALGGPSRLKKRVSAGTRAGLSDEVLFYTFERFPRIDSLDPLAFSREKN